MTKLFTLKVKDLNSAIEYWKLVVVLSMETTMDIASQVKTDFMISKEISHLLQTRRTISRVLS